MKALIFIIYILLLNQPALKSDWFESFNDKSYRLRDISVTKNGSIFILYNLGGEGGGNYTVIEKSTDKGLTWKTLLNYNPHDTSNVYRFLYDCSSISTPDDKNIYITFKQKGYIAYSNDYGENFIFKEIIGLTNINEIQMYDENIGMILTYTKNIITYNGWKDYEIREDFFNLDSIELIGDATDMKFISKDSIYLLAFRNENSSSLVKYNINTFGFESFVIDTNTYENKVPLFDFEILGNNKIIAVGGRSYGSDGVRYNQIYKSTNNGIDWTMKHEFLFGTPHGAAAGLFHVSFADETNGVAVGPKGTILFTRDEGESWDYIDYHPNIHLTVTIDIEWVDQTPIISTYNKGTYYYEGDYFNFGDKEYFDLSGSIVSNGSGLEGVDVKINNKTIKTEGEGLYKVDSLIEGSYIIKPISDEYSFEPNQIEIELNQDRHFIDFQAIPILNVEELTNSMIRVDYNSNIISIKSNSEYNFKLFNITGRNLINKSYNGNSIISISQLTPGVYIIELNLNNKKITNTFIKN